MKKLKILYTNANGITGKIPSLQAAIKEYKANMCCITETKIRTQTPVVENFNWETKNRKNKQGGGVAILTHTNLQNNISRVTNTEEQDQ